MLREKYFLMAEFDISRATVFRDYAKIKKITGAVNDKMNLCGNYNTESHISLIKRDYVLIEKC